MRNPTLGASVTARRAAAGASRAWEIGYAQTRAWEIGYAGTRAWEIGYASTDRAWEIG